MAEDQTTGGRNRVLILVENAPLPGDRRVEHEAVSLIANGYHVSVICPAWADQVPYESFKGVDVYRYRIKSPEGGTLAHVLEYLEALAKTFWLMLKISRKPGFDVIHACNPPDLFFLLAWPFVLFDKKFIFDQHDLSPELFASLYGHDRSLVISLLRLTEWCTYRLSTVVISSNESYRKIAHARGGIPFDRSFAVRNGPREDWPRPVEPDESLKAGSKYLVGYMGVMGKQDGVDALLSAIDVLVNKQGFTEAQFALIGDGNAEAELKKQAADLGIESYVDFVGWVADQDLLSRYLITADACVCPETSSPLNDHSTFIKVMEYMAAGTPIVAFDLPETRVSAGDAALYVQSGDIEGFAVCIKQVLIDEDLRARITAAAAKRIPGLRWETQVPNLLAAYRKALS